MHASPVKISVIIITKNEAMNMPGCIGSVAWADEVIVVDSGSSDATVAICRELGASTYVHEWPGFGAQKNRALAYARNDWVLSIDADERVSGELRAEIEATLERGGAEVAYKIPRLSSFCGRQMRHSGWYPDYVTRLFRRDAARFSDDLVHERVIATGKVGALRQDLLHQSYRDLDQLLVKMNQYSTAGAQMLLESGRQTSLKQAVGHAFWAFVRTYILRAGFMDGREGFMVAIATAEGTYYRYAKRMFLPKS